MTRREISERGTLSNPNMATLGSWAYRDWALGLVDRLSCLGARSIQPKFPEISVQNSMDRFGPTGKVSKKPFEVDQFSRSDRLEFWLNGSPPLALGLRPRARFARRAPLLLCAKGTQGQYLTNRKRKSKSWL